MPRRQRSPTGGQANFYIMDSGGLVPGTTRRTATAKRFQDSARAWPRVPGHEVVGRIDALGSGVQGWAVGQRVGVGFLGGFCGYCEFCRDGNLVSCRNQEYTGIRHDGGYAFDTLFNKRDYGAAEKFWSPNYIQHSAHIPPGRDGLFNLVKTLPPTLKYEHGTIVADGEFVIIHGRFSGFLSVNWIAADILRINDGVLLEHWDVIQGEATKKQSKSGLPIFGDRFPL